MYHDKGFWISHETRRDNRLFRKQISILVLGHVHHFVSYYNPWDIVNNTLKALSEDFDHWSLTLRTDLALQLTPSSFWTKHIQLLKVNPSLSVIILISTAYHVKDSSPIERLQFMQSALFFCLCFADKDLYEYLLQRQSRDWFPHVPSNSAYWDELSSRDPFWGMKPCEWILKWSCCLSTWSSTQAVRHFRNYFVISPLKTSQRCKIDASMEKSFAFCIIDFRFSGHSIRQR